LKRSPLVATFLSFSIVLLLLVAALPALLFNTTLASPVAFEGTEEDEDIFFFCSIPWSSAVESYSFIAVSTHVVLEGEKEAAVSHGFAFLSDHWSSRQKGPMRLHRIAFQTLTLPLVLKQKSRM
jgi:hypothetical protein